MRTAGLQERGVSSNSAAPPSHLCLGIPISPSEGVRGPRVGSGDAIDDIGDEGEILAARLDPGGLDAVRVADALGWLVLQR